MFITRNDNYISPNMLLYKICSHLDYITHTGREVYLTYTPKTSPSVHWNQPSKMATKHLLLISSVLLLLTLLPSSDASSFLSRAKRQNAPPSKKPCSSLVTQICEKCSYCKCDVNCDGCKQCSECADQNGVFDKTLPGCRFVILYANNCLNICLNFCFFL